MKKLKQTKKRVIKRGRSASIISETFEIEVPDNAPEWAKDALLLRADGLPWKEVASVLTKGGYKSKRGGPVTPGMCKNLVWRSKLGAE